MTKGKIDITELSLEELKELSKKVSDAVTSCATSCSQCCADSHNFKDLSGGCSTINAVIEMLVKIGEKKRTEKPANNSDHSGKCENCECVDKKFFEKSGCLFCGHWHNFTVKEGFCYAFRGVENSSEPVDN